VSRLAAPEPVSVRIRDLTKRFPAQDRPAVSGAGLDVEAGEILALVGESGCGKTTLLRVIAGLEVPDSGTVRLGHRPVTGPDWVAPERRGVGMVFQDFALFPHLTVIDNVAFGLGSLPRRERRERGARMLERVGLSGYEDRYPHQLSGGQKQRVALARALAPGPGLLLLDEPFSNLDVPLKATLREELASVLRAASVTTLLVVHEVDDVFFLADRIAVMRDGRVVQSGPPEEVHAAPRDEYVARLFGETNIFPVESLRRGVETPLGRVESNGAMARQASKALIRPRDVLISTEPLSGAPAVVEEVRGRGSRVRIRLSLQEPSDSRAWVVAEADESEARVNRGDRVYVRARPGGLRLLPERDRGD